MKADLPQPLDYGAVVPAPHARRFAGAVWLSVVTLIWGTTFVITRVLEAGGTATVPASLVIFSRFGVALLAFAPWLRADRRLWLVGLELGFWLWCGYATQAVGLAYTTVNRSAFITTLHVIFVPTLTALAGRRLWGGVWVAAGMALAGTALLSYDGGTPNRGDFWTIATALTYAVYIWRLEHVANDFPAKQLTAVQLAVVTLLSAGWVAAEHPALPHVRWHAVAGLIYLGLVATALTTWLQAIGQKSVPGWQASLLYTMEPVWASAFAWGVLGEALGLRGWAGAGLLVAAALLSQVPARRAAD